MKPSRYLKVWALILSFVLSGFFYYIGFNAVRMYEFRITATTCLFDPILHYLAPASAYLAEHKLFKDIITAIDGIFIDLSLVIMGLVYLLTAKSISFLPTTILFYAVRAIANNIVIFPIPDIYVFEDPGIPSYFVDYRRLNDLYYSGHTGMFVVYIVDCFQNKRARWNFLFVPFCLYTVFILLVEGIHYTNDIIYGFASAAFLSRIIYRYRYDWNILYFKGVVLIIRIIQGTYNFLRERICQFPKQRSRDLEAPGVCPSVNQSSLENVNVSAYPEASRPSN